VTAFMPGQKWPKIPQCRTVNLDGAHIWKAAADAKHVEDSSDSDNDTLDTHVKRSAAALADAEPAQKKPRRADTSPPG